MKPKAELKTVQPKGAYLNQSELINNLCVETGLSRKEAKLAFTAIQSIGHTELKKRGKFVFPGMARFVTKKKLATKARMGRNPFTGEQMMFKAKPACTKVKAYTMKAFR